MKTRRAGWAWAVLAGALLGVMPGCGESPEHSYVLATATQGGTYYPVGSAIEALVQRELQGEHSFAVNAISSAGSEENIMLMRRGEAQFAILQGLYGAWAWHGEQRFAEAGQQEFLRSITTLWPNVEHFVIEDRYAGTGLIDDLRNLEGMRFSIGARGSGSEGSARHILTSLGIDPEAPFNLVHQGYGRSAESLQDGAIAGMNTPAGVPVAAVSQAAAAMNGRLRVLGFDEDHLDAVNAQYRELWSFYEIPAETYSGQDEAVRTIAQPNFLVVHRDMDEQTVYELTKALYENLPFLRAIHSATEAMSLETATTGLPVPLHPGAVRYYEEVGVEIPEHLRP